MAQRPASPLEPLQATKRLVVTFFPTSGQDPATTVVVKPGAPYCSSPCLVLSSRVPQMQRTRPHSLFPPKTTVGGIPRGPKLPPAMSEALLKPEPSSSPFISKGRGLFP